MTASELVNRCRAWTARPSVLAAILAGVYFGVGALLWISPPRAPVRLTLVVSSIGALFFGLIMYIVLRVQRRKVPPSRTRVAGVRLYLLVFVLSGGAVNLFDRLIIIGAHLPGWIAPAIALVAVAVAYVCIPARRRNTGQGQAAGETPTTRRF